jgi:putative transposase
MYRERFGVEPICRELEVSDSAYYARQRRSPSRRQKRDAELVEKLRRVHQASDGTYGAWRSWKQLNREGIPVARCTVERLMRQQSLEGIRRGRTRRTTIPAAKPSPAPDLVKRRFSATRPDEVWIADFTYIRTWQGWTYLAIVVDVYTRLIVGWQLASHMRQELVDDALAMAIAARPDRAPSLVHHGDNGSQYASWAYTQRLQDAGIRPSRGRTGTALDNAMAESVIATIKTELVKRRPWPTRLDLELALVAYIGWYNTLRIHRSLGGLTPAEKDHDYKTNRELETTRT